MDFETLFRSFAAFLRQSDNAYFLAYAILSCLLTLLCNKLFFRKKSLNLFGINFVGALPFLFGLAFAAADVFFFHAGNGKLYAKFVQTLSDAALIGAMATVLYDWFCSFGNKNIQKMLSDDAFALVYSQLLYCGGVKERLHSGEITLARFATEAKALADELTKLYSSPVAANERKSRLFQAVSQFVGSNDVSVIVNSLDAAFVKNASRPDSD